MRDQRPTCATATQANDAAVLGSLELSQSTWLLTSMLPGSEKMSRHTVSATDRGQALLALLARLRAKAEAGVGAPVGVVLIHEAGLDGFWPHRLLTAHGIESHVVDPASILVSQRRRRAKTDKIDGESLLRTLLGWRRGEPRVCSMVVPPSVEEEDARRLVRERDALVGERTVHANRIRGLLSCQGAGEYHPLRRDARAQLASLETGDGRALPPKLRMEIERELDRLELVQRQIAAVEAERDALLAAADPGTAGAALLRLRSLGPEFATVLWLEGLFRRFANRRRVAAYAGLAATPWRSGSIDYEQGISKAGNPRLRRTLIQLAWLWLRHQPGSALSQWFQERVGSRRGRERRIAVVALARKLLIALWRFVTQGVLPEGAALKPAV
jgi:transposase